LHGAHVPEQLGVVVAEGFGRKIVVFDDRVHMGAAAHAIDKFTEAQVYLDGQVQITTRPSMTAAAFGSVLPGSALIPAMAFGKKEKTDTRVAEFQIGSRDWSLRTKTPVGGLSTARSIAQRVNAIASGLADEAATRQAPQARLEEDADFTRQIERIVELERSGAISSEQAALMKARVIGI
jgi:hypothetical protein